MSPFIMVRLCCLRTLYVVWRLCVLYIMCMQCDSTGWKYGGSLVLECSELYYDFPDIPVVSSIVVVVLQFDRLVCVRVILELC